MAGTQNVVLANKLAIYKIISDVDSYFNVEQYEVILKFLTAIPVKTLLEQEVDLGSDITRTFYLHNEATSLKPECQFLKNLLFSSCHVISKQIYEKAYEKFTEIIKYSTFNDWVDG